MSQQTRILLSPPLSVSDAAWGPASRSQRRSFAMILMTLLLVFGLASGPVTGQEEAFGQTTQL